MAERAEISIRPMGQTDIEAVVRLCASSLAWRDDEPNEDFFRWKHLENPFGASPGWLALDGDSIVGVRVMLRWRFRGPAGTVEAVRAVDTATHPDHQGRGIFTSLTLAAVQDLGSQGVALVFNTPNDKSRPGYLKMGWSVVGRVPVAVAPCRPAGLVKVLRARVPAAKFSDLAGPGEPAPQAFADEAAVADLLSTQPPPSSLATERSPAFYRWRYGMPAMGYRVVTAGPGGSSLSRGFVVYRLRRRGPAVEATVCDVVTPGADRRTARRLLSTLRRTGGADVLLRAGGPLWDGTPFVPLPRQGPVLTWRPLAAGGGVPEPRSWRLTMGDIEVF